MRIEELTEPVATHGVGPVFLLELKDYLRIDHDDLDAELGSLMKAATRAIEQASGMILMSRSVALWLDRWPAGDASRPPWWDGVQEGAVRDLTGSQDPIALAVRPIESLAKIEVFDAAGLATAIDLSGVHLTTGLDPVLSRSDGHWPNPDRPSEGIRIEVVAGFGTNPNQVPADLALAVKLLTAHYFLNRGGEPGQPVSGLPKIVQSLLAPFTRRRV